MNSSTPEPTPDRAAVLPLTEILADLKTSEAVAGFLRREGVPYRGGVDPVTAWVRRMLGRDDVRVSGGTFELIIGTEYAGELPPPAVFFLTRLRTGSTAPAAVPPEQQRAA